MGRELKRAIVLAVLAAMLAACERISETQADMRMIATAWEARATDIKSYSVNGVGDGPVTTQDLAEALAPTYLKSIPLDDPYGGPYLFEER